MKRWEKLASATVVGGEEEMILMRRDTEYSIRIGYTELMNSRVHHSEDTLATAAIENQPQDNLPVLVGGLGMGYTLRAALDSLGEKAKVTVAELVPAVVQWHKEYLGHLADNPLEDSRVTLYKGDVRKALKPNYYGSILYDVDNGPEGLTRQENSSLYGYRGVEKVYNSLVDGGIFAVWSTGRNEVFTERLEKAGFIVDLIKTRERAGKGSIHFVWVAIKPSR